VGEAFRGTGPGETGVCRFTPTELVQADRVARRDVGDVSLGWTLRRRTFDSLPGWRVAIRVANGQPLWPQGFDPLNVERVEGGLLHTRFLQLGNDAGEIRMIDEAGADLEALTEAVGPHPLFNGVRLAVIAGLAEPAIQVKDGEVSVSRPGVTIRLRGAAVRRGAREVLIVLESAR
jgi:hypothetical protein